MGRAAMRLSTASVISATRFALAVLALAALVAASTAAASVRATPSLLAGRWSRTVTAADWRPAGGGFPVGRWSIVLKKNGQMDVYTPGVAGRPDFSARVTAVGATLTIANVPVCSSHGRYTWRVRGSTLTLRVASDKHCAARVALFSGSWMRSR